MHDDTPDQHETGIALPIPTCIDDSFHSVLKFQLKLQTSSKVIIIRQRIKITDFTKLYASLLSRDHIDIIFKRRLCHAFNAVTTPSVREILVSLFTMSSIITKAHLTTAEADGQQVMFGREAEEFRDSLLRCAIAPMLRLLSAQIT